MQVVEARHVLPADLLQRLQRGALCQLPREQRRLQRRGRGGGVAGRRAPLPPAVVAVMSVRLCVGGGLRVLDLLLLVAGRGGEGAGGGWHGLEGPPGGPPAALVLLLMLPGRERQRVVLLLLLMVERAATGVVVPELPSGGGGAGQHALLHAERCAEAVGEVQLVLRAVAGLLQGLLGERRPALEAPGRRASRPPPHWRPAGHGVALREVLRVATAPAVLQEIVQQVHLVAQAVVVVARVEHDARLPAIRAAEPGDAALGVHSARGAGSLRARCSVRACWGGAPPRGRLHGEPSKSAGKSSVTRTSRACVHRGSSHLPGSLEPRSGAPHTAPKSSHLR